MYWCIVGPMATVNIQTHADVVEELARLAVRECFITSVMEHAIHNRKANIVIVIAWSCQLLHCPSWCHNVSRTLCTNTFFYLVYLISDTTEEKKFLMTSRPQVVM